MLYTSLFYVLFGILLLIFILLIYTSYNHFDKVKMNFLSLSLLRVIIILTTGILYMPILFFLLSFTKCTNVNNENVHFYFNEVQCYSGEHLIPSIFSIIIAIIFIIYSLFCSLFMVEYRMIFTNPICKYFGEANLLILIYKTLVLASFNYFNHKYFHFIHIFLILAGSLFLFNKFYGNRIFYNEKMNKLISILSAEKLWTSIMLIYGYVN